jgi:hypothetical protein
MALDRLDIAIFYSTINDSIGPEDAQNIIPDKLHPCCYNTAINLAARYTSILEVSQFSDEGSGVGPMSQIEHLHAIALAFLDKDDNWLCLLGFIVDVDFNPCVSLMKALVLDLSLTLDRKESLERKIPNLRQFRFNNLQNLDCNIRPTG